jgi:hypothetical protein
MDAKEGGTRTRIVNSELHVKAKVINRAGRKEVESATPTHNAIKYCKCGGSGRLRLKMFGNAFTLCGLRDSLATAVRLILLRVM